SLYPPLNMTSPELYGRGIPTLEFQFPPSLASHIHGREHRYLRGLNASLARKGCTVTVSSTYDGTSATMKLQGTRIVNGLKALAVFIKKHKTFKGNSDSTLADYDVLYSIVRAALVPAQARQRGEVVERETQDPEIQRLREEWSVRVY
ncbi:hypothetical protein KIPB_010349, partial [Kipferlia bialata]